MLLFFYKLELEEFFYMFEVFFEGVIFIENGGKLFCLVGLWGFGKMFIVK